MSDCGVDTLEELLGAVAVLMLRVGLESEKLRRAGLAAAVRYTQEIIRALKVLSEGDFGPANQLSF